MTGEALSIDALEAAVQRMAEDSLTPHRRAALERVKKNGLPTTRDEDWKYTELAPAFDVGNRWLGHLELPVGAAPPLARSITESIDATWFIIANGAIIGDCTAAGASVGIEVRRISELGAQATIDAPLADLNAALLQDGLRIVVPADAHLTKPIGLLCIDETTKRPAMSQLRIELELADAARCEVLEYHASVGTAPHFANAVINLRLGAEARAAYVRIQRRGPLHMQAGRLDVDQARGSEFSHAAFDLDGRLVRNDLQVSLTGAHASADLSGLYLAGTDQHIDNHIRVDHRIGPATSRQEYRGVLAANARCVWNGKAVVHSGADGTDAEQANHNLLLSRGAEMDAKPELEIYADEVQCSHGATVGQLDERALFYLRTRGIRREEATRILTKAFGSSIVSRLPIAALHDTLADWVDARLSRLTEDSDR